MVEPLKKSIELDKLKALRNIARDIFNVTVRYDDNQLKMAKDAIHWMKQGAGNLIDKLDDIIEK